MASQHQASFSPSDCPSPDSYAFEACWSGDIPALLNAAQDDELLRRFLPFLVGRILVANNHPHGGVGDDPDSKEKEEVSKSIYARLANEPKTNSVLSYYHLDYDVLRTSMLEELKNLEQVPDADVANNTGDAGAAGDCDGIRDNNNTSDSNGIGEREDNGGNDNNASIHLDNSITNSQREFNISLSPPSTSSVHTASHSSSSILFECGDPLERMKLMLTEILQLVTQRSKKENNTKKKKQKSFVGEHQPTLQEEKKEKDEEENKQELVAQETQKSLKEQEPSSDLHTSGGGNGEVGGDSNNNNNNDPSDLVENNNHDHPNDDDEEYTSDIFSNKIYLDELALMLPIAQMYDAFGVSSVSVALALATCPHSLPLISALVLNHPPFLFDLLGPLVDAYVAHVACAQHTSSRSANAFKSISSSSEDGVVVEPDSPSTTPTLTPTLNPAPSCSSSSFSCCSTSTFIANLPPLLFYLSSLSRPVAESIREILLEHNLFPELILTITTSHIKDASLFLGSIVVSHQPHRYQWLKDYIETENNSNHNHETDAVDVTPIYHKNNSNNNTSSSGNGNSSNSTAYNALQAALQHSLSQSSPLRIAFQFRLYAALMGMLGFKLGEEEAELVLSKLMTPTQLKNTSLQMTGICLLLVWEGLLNVISVNVKQSIGTLLKSFIHKNNQENDGLAQGLLVLLQAHFQTQTQQTHNPLVMLGSPHVAHVAGVVRSALGIPVAIHGESLLQFSTAFEEDLLLPPELPFQLALQYNYDLYPQTHTLCLLAVHQLLKSGVIPLSITTYSGLIVDLIMWMWFLITQTTFLPSSGNANLRIPPLLPAIIILVVESAEAHVHTHAHGHPATTGTNSGCVPESDVHKCLSFGSDDPNSIGPVQVLALYYVLLHNEKVEKQHNATANSIISPPILKLASSSMCEYSNELLSVVPVRAIIAHMHANLAIYSTIYPSLMNLTVSHFPQLFDTPSLLMPHDIQSVFDHVHVGAQHIANSGHSIETSEIAAEPVHEHKSVLSPSSISCLFTSCSNHYSSSSPSLPLCACNSSSVLFFLTQLHEASTTVPEYLQPYSNIIIDTLLPSLVTRQWQKLKKGKTGVDGGLATAIQSLWFSLFKLTPWTLALRTVHALWDIKDTEVAPMSNQSNISGSSAKPPPHMSLVMDPLLVLRVDNRVWHVPALVQILLQILSFYMAASRQAIQTRTLGINFSVNTDDNNNSNTTEMECTALMMAQDSAAIQILLEAIHLYITSKAESDFAPLNTNKDGINSGRAMLPKGIVNESIANICMFIHQMFIAQPLLAKLIHFQGYPLTLIPLTVAHIPSMHICLDFMLELLLHSHQAEKLLFATNLACYLVGQYPLPHTLPIAKQTLELLPHLHTLYSACQFQVAGACQDKNVLNIENKLENIVANVGRLCAAFPLLAEDALHILDLMANSSRSQGSQVQIQLASTALKSVVGLFNMGTAS